MEMRVMKRLLQLAVLPLFIVVLSVVPAHAQSADGANAVEISKVIHAFTAKENEFRQALNNYSFKRDALLQKIGMGGQVEGEYHKISLLTFDDSGNRYEKISFFPMPSLPEVTNEDIEDLGGVEPFALEPSNIERYDIRYVGKEKIDELNLYVFDVTPKVMPDPKKTKVRLFQGRIWVDDQDLQIVKTKGKGVPETKANKFPIVETYREHIDGRYWFPTYSYADEELIYENGGSLHIRMKVRYSDFTPARATLKVTEVGEDENPSSNAITKPVDEGVLNPQATTLPTPRYPEEAKRLKIVGRVTVRVVVDENGKVVSATATEGPAALRQSAEDAARTATFKPKVAGGITVKMTGILTFDFKLP